eukprot:11181292-Lingulodinium_polyedra.AAC.1
MPIGRLIDERLAADMSIAQCANLLHGLATNSRHTAPFNPCGGGGAGARTTPCPGYCCRHSTAQ